MSLLKNILATTPVIGAGIAAHDSAKTAKLNAKLDAAVKGMQAQISDFNATQAEMYGRLNADILTAVGGVNSKLTAGIADLNGQIITATTDFNVGIIGATTDFNVKSAEGAAKFLEAQGEFQAGLHRTNADLADADAEIALDQGSQAERISRQQYATIKSTQRARLAASGVALDEGSALRIQSDTDYLSDVDADTIKTNAIRTAMGYRVTAANERASAAFASIDAQARSLDKRMEAVAAKINGQVAIANEKFGGATKQLDLKLTSSMQILQNEMNTKLGVYNTLSQARQDAWNYRTQAFSYRAGATQDRYAASRIDPTFQGIAAGTQQAVQIAMAFI